MSSEQVAAIGGALGGLFVSEYVASSLITATKVTGTAQLAVGIVSKAGLGLLFWYGATRVEGVMKNLLWLASVGSFASMGLDIIHQVFPRATAGLVSRLSAPPARLGRPIRVRPVAPTAAPAPAAPAVQFK